MQNGGMMGREREEGNDCLYMLPLPEYVCVKWRADGHRSVTHWVLNPLHRAAFFPLKLNPF